MTIKEGDRLPDATLLHFGEDGPGSVELSELTAGTVVLFGVPGAFTRTCTAAHVPSFVRTADAFRAKGVARIVCVAVNDPFVMAAWSESTGAAAAGIEMYGDADGALTRAMGLDFDAPPVGLHGRSKRFAMVVEDGVVRALDVEDSPGACTVSSGEALLEKV